MNKKDPKHHKRIKKGDRVIITCGNDKGLVGEVLFRTKGKVTVKGANVRKKHVKKTQENPSGGVIELERPIHLSNVALCLDEEKVKKIKVGFNSEGKRLLLYREGGTDVPIRQIKSGEKT